MALKVRPFSVDDTDHLRFICCATAAERPFLPWVDEPRLACELFLDPYLQLESESCFVAELDGHIVGYLVGTRDVKEFWLRENIHVQQHLLRLLQIQIQGLVNRRFRHFLSHCVLAKMYWNALFRRLRKNPGSVGYFDVDRYPALCHLQVAPEARGKCAGLMLLLTFHQYLKANGVCGHHGSVVEESGREEFSSMLLALHFRVVHERQFTSRDVRTLAHPGVWTERLFVREL